MSEKDKIAQLEKDEKIEQYSHLQPSSFTFLKKALDILSLLASKNIEAYIIGEAARNYILNLPLQSITILVGTTPSILKQVLPLVINKDSKTYIFDDLGDIFFKFYANEVNLTNKELSYHYNAKLTYALKNEDFTINMFVLTLNLEILDIFKNDKYIKKQLITPLEKPKGFFSKDPERILKVLQLVAEQGFEIEKSTYIAMKRCASLLANVDKDIVLDYSKTIIKEKHSKEAIDIIIDDQIFKVIPDLNNFYHRVKKYANKLTPIEKATLLYLQLGSISDANKIDKESLQIITENLMIAQYLMDEKVTPMMVYHFGVESLLSCDKIAKAYKKTYHMQARKIQKISKHLVITRQRDLQFSYLELSELMNHEKSIRNKVVMNLLLERVLNRKVKNKSAYLKYEALEIIKEMDSVFAYDNSVQKEEYTEEEIKELQKKYHQEFDFLVKVYLSDEKNMYCLSANERKEVTDNAREHARSFLLETPQYQILVERSLI